MSRSDPPISLRGLELGDAEFVLGLMRTPGYLQFVGDRGVKTLAQAREYLSNYFLASQAKHGFGYDIVFVGDRPAGMVGLMKRDYLDHPDIGFAFMPEFGGRGVAYRACVKYLEQVQAALHVNTLVAFTDADNVPSQKLLERLRFRFLRDFEHPQEQVPMKEYELQLK